MTQCSISQFCVQVLPTIKKDKKSAVYRLAVYDIRQFTLQEDWGKNENEWTELTDIQKGRFLDSRRSIQTYILTRSRLQTRQKGTPGRCRFSTEVGKGAGLIFAFPVPHSEVNKEGNGGLIVFIFERRVRLCFSSAGDVTQCTPLLSLWSPDGIPVLAIWEPAGVASSWQYLSHLNLLMRSFVFFTDVSHQRSPCPVCHFFYNFCPSASGGPFLRVCTNMPASLQGVEV